MASFRAVAGLGDPEQSPSPEALFPVMEGEAARTRRNAIRPVVHIGYHKTATKWFQKHFYPSVENADFVPRETVRSAFLEPTAFHFDPERARAMLHDAGSGPILCEEGLSGYLHNGGLAGCLSKDVAYRIKAVFPEARIVIFIKSQPAVVAGSYEQYVRGGGTFTPRRYLFPKAYLRGALGEVAKAPGFTFDHFEYGPLIAHYRGLFGADSVHVFPYEAFRDEPKDFLKSYCEVLGLEVDLDKVSMQRVNRSYGLAVLALVRLLNHLTYRTVQDKHWLVHIPYWYAFVRAVGEALNRLPWIGRAPAPRELLGGEINAWVQQRFCRSNRELMAQTGLPLDK
jgi:hypothetical protein